MQRRWPIFLTVALSFAQGNSFAKAELTQSVAKESFFASQQQFARRLLQQVIHESSPNDNVFLSPVSVNIALSMLLEGAKGATKTEMLKALNLPQDFSTDELRKLQHDYMASLQQTSEGNQIVIGNGLWVDKAYPIFSNFSDNLIKFYDAKVENADFKNEPAEVASQINQWASDKTFGKISQIITPGVVENLEMLLANATYFKGSWQQEFNKDKTKEMDFQTEQGPSKVEMMQVSLKAKYLEDNYQAIRLPYKGETLAMYVILPPQNLDISEREWTSQNVLQSEFWQNLDLRLHTSQVELALPKFRLSKSYLLNDSLIALGFADIFANPDFSALSPMSSQVGFVKQDTFIQVDEQGTEAAAVTSIGIRATAIVTPTQMIVDRPFFLAIRDEKTKSFLFMGYMANPSW